MNWTSRRNNTNSHQHHLTFMFCMLFTNAWAQSSEEKVLSSPSKWDKRSCRGPMTHAGRPLITTTGYGLCLSRGVLSASIATARHDGIGGWQRRVCCTHPFFKRGVNHSRKLFQKKKSRKKILKIPKNPKKSQKSHKIPDPAHAPSKGVIYPSFFKGLFVRITRNQSLGNKKSSRILTKFLSYWEQHIHPKSKC